MSLKRFTPALVVILALLVVLNLIITSFLFYTVVSVDDRVTDFEEDVELITDYLLQSGELKDNKGSVSAVERQSGSLVAYDDNSRVGVVVDYTYQPLPGESIYVDSSEVRVEGDFQDSLSDAQQAIGESDYEPETKGMAVSLTTPGDWEYISGESAGLAMAAHIASTDPRYKLNDSVALTGQVGSNGDVVSVTNIEPKANAAGESGKELLVAPYSVESVRTSKIDVVRVGTIDEALNYALDEVE